MMPTIFHCKDYRLFYDQHKTLRRTFTAPPPLNGHTLFREFPFVSDFHNWGKQNSHRPWVWAAGWTPGCVCPCVGKGIDSIGLMPLAEGPVVRQTHRRQAILEMYQSMWVVTLHSGQCRGGGLVSASALLTPSWKNIFKEQWYCAKINAWQHSCNRCIIFL